MGSPIEHLAAPPRDVPLTVAVRLLFGGLAAVGWFLLAFSSLFVWMFAGQADIASLWQFRGTLTKTSAAVIGCTETGASENKRRIYETTFAFAGSTRRSYGKDGCVAPGTVVTIEHPTGRPELARVEGMRRKTFGAWALMVMVFPAIAVGFIWAGTAQGRRRVRLLSIGRLGWGQLVRKEATNLLVNKRRVMKLDFQLETLDGQKHLVTVRSHMPERVEDQPKERFLYDPAQPRDAVPIDMLPDGLPLDGGGRLRPAGVIGAAVLLVFPLVTVFANLWRLERAIRGE